MYITYFTDNILLLTSIAGLVHVNDLDLTTQILVSLYHIVNTQLSIYCDITGNRIRKKPNSKISVIQYVNRAKDCKCFGAWPC